jgi:hypothetical protein
MQCTCTKESSKNHCLSADDEPEPVILHVPSSDERPEIISKRDSATSPDSESFTQFTLQCCTAAHLTDICAPLNVSFRVLTSYKPIVRVRDAVVER